MLLLVADYGTNQAWAEKTNVFCHLLDASLMGQDNPVTQIQAIASQWGQTFASYKQSTHSPVTIGDCESAISHLDALFGCITPLCVDVSSCQAGAGLLEQAMFDLAPWLVKDTSQYVGWLSTVCRFWTFGMEREKAVNLLAVGDRITSKMSKIPSLSLTSDQQLLEATVARIYYWRARVAFHLHFADYTSAISASKEIFAAYLELGKVKSLSKQAQYNYLLSLVDAHFFNAGLIMHVCQLYPELNNDQKKKDLADLMNYPDTWEPLIQQNPVSLSVIAKVHAFLGNHDQAQLYLDKFGATATDDINARFLFLETSVFLNAQRNADDSVSVIALREWFDYWLQHRSYALPPSIKECDNLDTLFILYLRSGDRDLAVEIQKVAAIEKTKLRQVLLTSGTEQQKIDAVRVTNELSLIFDLLDTETVANTVLNAKGAVLSSILHEAGRLPDLAISDIQRSLDTRSIYFDFVDYEDWRDKSRRLFVLKISRNAFSVRSLPISETLLQSKGRVVNAVKSAFDVGTIDVLRVDADLNLLSTSLFKEDDFFLESGESACRIFINPSGFLHDMPWWGLPAKDGTPLVTQFDFSIVLSPRSLISARVSSALSSATIIADPEFDTEYALPGSQTEAELSASVMAAANIDVTKYIGDRAVSDRIWEKSDILHLSCHASEKYDRRPYSSPVLRLRHPDGTGISELAPFDIVSVPRSRRLCVLAACFSGRGDSLPDEGKRQYEGRFGLVRAFLVSGSDHVLASLWQVSDSSSPEFFKTFYGMLPAENVVSAFNKTLRQQWNSSNPKNLVTFLCLYGGFAIYH